MKSKSTQPRSHDNRIQKKVPARIFAPADASFSGKLIVGVHGMGNQTRNDFAQTLARLFSRYFVLKRKDSYQARLLPLGAWDGGAETSVDDPALRFLPSEGVGGLEQFAFAEIYWADIARSMEDSGYRLEEATHWARSVVERVAHRNPNPDQFGPKQFHLAGFVIESIAETLVLLQKIAALGKLFSVSRKQIDTTLTQYLCDVQQVGDFQRQREKLRDRFFNRLENLHMMYPSAEIHLIAHSEGSAVSLFSLLTALNAGGRAEVEEMRRDRQSESLAPETRGHRQKRELDWKWVGQLSSFTTLGSPIDKHIHLWPEMWSLFDANPAWCDSKLIRWRNYYDYADPVGYQLDSVEEKLIEWDCRNFQFYTSLHDHGFRRYPVPGKAHVDYFQDDGLFAHIIEDSVGFQPEGGADARAEIPPSKWQGWVSTALPFVIVGSLMFAAVFVLNRGLMLTEEARAALKESRLGYPEITGPSSLIGQWALLLGTTALARIVRLTRTPGMVIIAFFLFLAGCAVFASFPGTSGFEIGHRASRLLFGQEEMGGSTEQLLKFLVIVCAALAVVTAWLADYLSCLFRLRAVWSIRLFVISGTAFIFFSLVLPRLYIPEGESSATLFSSLAGFGVLWWLGILLFDLSFCWQRYINTSRNLLKHVCKAGDPPA